MIKRLFDSWTGKNRRKTNNPKKCTKWEGRIIKVEGQTIYKADRLGDIYPYSINKDEDTILSFPWDKRGIDIIRNRYGIIRRLFDVSKDENGEIVNRTKGFRFTFSERCVDATGMSMKNLSGNNIVHANKSDRRRDRFKIRNIDGREDILDNVRSLEYIIHQNLDEEIFGFNPNEIVKLRVLLGSMDKYQDGISQELWERFNSFITTTQESIAISELVRNQYYEPRNLISKNYEALRLKKFHYGNIPAIDNSSYIPGITDFSSGKVTAYPVSDSFAFFGLIKKREFGSNSSDAKFLLSVY